MYNMKLGSLYIYMKTFGEMLNIAHFQYLRYFIDMALID